MNIRCENSGLLIKDNLAHKRLESEFKNKGRNMPIRHMGSDGGQTTHTTELSNIDMVWWDPLTTQQFWTVLTNGFIKYFNQSVFI